MRALPRFFDADVVEAGDHAIPLECTVFRSGWQVRRASYLPDPSFLRIFQSTGARSTRDPARTGPRPWPYVILSPAA